MIKTMKIFVPPYPMHWYVDTDEGLFVVPISRGWSGRRRMPDRARMTLKYLRKVEGIHALHTAHCLSMPDPQKYFPVKGGAHGHA